MAPSVPAKFDADMHSMGYTRVARFTRYDHILDTLRNNTAKQNTVGLAPQYAVAYACQGVWSAYPVTIRRLRKTACVVSYHNTGEGPLVTSDASALLLDDLPRRVLTPRSASYVLYASK